MGTNGAVGLPVYHIKILLPSPIFKLYLRKKSRCSRHLLLSILFLEVVGYFSEVVLTLFIHILPKLWCVSHLTRLHHPDSPQFLPHTLHPSWTFWWGWARNATFLCSRDHPLYTHSVYVWFSGKSKPGLRSSHVVQQMCSWSKETVGGIPGICYSRPYVMWMSGAEASLFALFVAPALISNSIFLFGILWHCPIFLQKPSVLSLVFVSLKGLLSLQHTLLPDLQVNMRASTHMYEHIHWHDLSIPTQQPNGSQTRESCSSSQECCLALWPWPEHTKDQSHRFFSGWVCERNSGSLDSLLWQNTR